MKLRKRQVVLLAALVILAMSGIAVTAYHLRARHALAAYQKFLVASGEKLTIDELLPPPVPPEQDGASIFFDAMAQGILRQDLFMTNPPNSMTAVAPGKARVSWAQPEIRSADATNTWEEAIATRETYATSLFLLAELIERPHLDFKINYQLGFSVPLPNLAQTKSAAQLLCWAAACDLHRDDAQSATKHLRAVLALVHGSAEDRLFISQLVRMAIAALAAGSTWELLQSPHLTEADLASLQADWSRLEFTRPGENAMAMERAMSQMSAEQMRGSSAEFNQIVSGYSWPGAAAAGPSGDWLEHASYYGKVAWDRSRLKAKETAWRFAWSYPDQLRALKGKQVLLEALRTAETQGNFKAARETQEAALDALGIESLEKDDYFSTAAADLDLRTIFSQSVNTLTYFLNKLMTIEASRRLVLTAMALQRYQLAHGTYPPDLNALVPKYLTALPRDPVDGEPLRYQLNPDGTFLLYSIGEDGEDNGGDPKPAKPDSKSVYWQRGRDWVWPRPATAEEIAEHFKRKSP